MCFNTFNGLCMDQEIAIINLTSSGRCNFLWIKEGLQAGLLTGAAVRLFLLINVGNKHKYGTDVYCSYV